MTIEALITTKREQDRDTSPDSSLAAAQFEAIIRAWKGEAVDQSVPTSPVGEADLDGSLSLERLGTSPMMCDDYFISWLLQTWECLPNTLNPPCSSTCTWSYDPNNCQVV